jgi:hypothetical protein
VRSLLGGKDSAGRFQQTQSERRELTFRVRGCPC